MQAWAELQAVLKEPMDEKTYWLVSLAAAMAGGSSYCSLAFGSKLANKYYTVAELSAIIRDDPENPLTRAERLIVRLARKVSTDACICQSKCAVTVEDIATLGEAGISDAQVFDIVAAAAARSFFSKVPNALGVLADAALGDIGEPPVSLLAVGRAVEARPGEQGRTRRNKYHGSR
jgi:alkylhydroperoxidase family enzyme